MAKQIYEIQAYEYNSEADRQNEIESLKNTEWEAIKTYESNGKFIAEYKKTFYQDK